MISTEDQCPPLNACVIDATDETIPKYVAKGITREVTEFGQPPQFRSKLGYSLTCLAGTAVEVELLQYHRWLWQEEGLINEGKLLHFDVLK